MQGMKSKDKYAKCVQIIRSCKLVRRPSCAHPAFSCVAIWSLNFMSCIFTPREFDGCHYQVLHFHSPRLSSCSFRAAVMSNRPPREIDIGRDGPTTFRIHFPLQGRHAKFGRSKSNAVRGYSGVKSLVTVERGVSDLIDFLKLKISQELFGYRAHAHSHTNKQTVTVTVTSRLLSVINQPRNEPTNYNAYSLRCQKD